MANYPLRGVNLGGWLVLEKWITPSLFEATDAVDEYTYSERLGPAARNQLKKFRDSFITKQDFSWIARHDLQAVRLPLGHWVFGKEPPYVETLEYVDKTFKWAEEYGLKVLIDLHAVRGSQNGRDHSGRTGKVAWQRDKSNAEQSLEVITKLAQRYGDSRSLLGISLLNEPHPLIAKRNLLNFYQAAFKSIRLNCSRDAWVVFSDGYLPMRWRKEMPETQFPGTYIDTHHYQIFTPLDKMLPPGMNLWRAKHQLPYKLRRLKRYHPVIVGEWSLTLGSRKLARLESEQQSYYARTYAQAQLTAFKSASAWFFWTYKTEAGGTWSYRDCLGKGWLPDQYD